MWRPGSDGVLFVFLRRVVWSTLRRDAGWVSPPPLTWLCHNDYHIMSWLDLTSATFTLSPQEFEVIAQIKLLQSACNSYCLTPEPAFLRWFKSQALLSEEERYCCFAPLSWLHHYPLDNKQISAWGYGLLDLLLETNTQQKLLSVLSLRFTLLLFCHVFTPYWSIVLYFSRPLCLLLSFSLALRSHGSFFFQFYLRFLTGVLFCSYALSCEIEGLGDSSPTSPKPRKSMVKRLSLWVHPEDSCW